MAGKLKQRPHPLLHLIAGCLFIANTKAENVAPPSQDMPAFLQSYVDQQTIPGAVALVATKDKILEVEAVGFMNVVTKKPMPKDAIFAVASMGKPIAATALMMLVDEGKVNVDDSVEKYLPEFKGQMFVAEQDANHMLFKKPTHPILIREILSHTSGLPYSSLVERPKIQGVNSESMPLDALPLEMAVRTYAATPLMFDPGAKYSYSSAGINTAARIVEVVSGMPYSDFLDQRLFGPLGMKDTTFWPTEEQLARHPSFYKAGPNKTGLVEEKAGRFTYPLSDRAHRYVIPGSGLFSTAGDMAKFCQMFLNGGVVDGKTYLSPASTKAMTTKQTPATDKTEYGFGWVTDKQTYSHGGSFHTFMHVFPQQGLIAIFMTQVEYDWPQGGDKLIPQFQDIALAKFKQP